jgi:hypothetical protein
MVTPCLRGFPVLPDFIKEQSFETMGRELEQMRVKLVILDEETIPGNDTKKEKEKDSQGFLEFYPHILR